MKDKKANLRKFFSNLDLMIMCGFLVVIFLTLFVQVFMRWVVGKSLTWSEEIARYSYVWITMLALGYNQRTNNNISMNLLTERLPRVARLVISVVTDILVIVVCCLPFRSIMQFLELNIRMKSNTLHYSLGLVAVSIPIGFVYLIIMLVFHCIREIIRYRKGEEL